MASRAIYEQTFDENVQQNHNTCPECEGRVTTNVAETVCDDCGLVIEADRIDRGPEWRAFDEDRSRNRRAGSPNTVARHDRGIGTEIGWGRDSDDDTWGYTRPGTIRRYYSPLQHRSIASSAQKTKAKKEPETRRSRRRRRPRRAKRKRAASDRPRPNRSLPTTDLRRLLSGWSH